jgi:hypothetical protein
MYINCSFKTATASAGLAHAAFLLKQLLPVQGYAMQPYSRCSVAMRPTAAGETCDALTHFFMLLLLLPHLRLSHAMIQMAPSTRAAHCGHATTPCWNLAAAAPTCNQHHEA